MNKPYVFGIGFPKTGSTSLNVALNILGIPSLHYDIPQHYCKTKLKPKLDTLFRGNAESNKRMFYPLDKDYQGFIDFRGEYYYETLYTQYPNSKFIFTKRNFLDWFDSIIVAEEKLWQQLKFLKMHPREHGKRHAEKARTYFNKTEEIKNFFSDKPHQYLELDICGGDGWKPLCKFLDVPVPNMAFPHENDTKTKMLKQKNESDQITVQSQRQWKSRKRQNRSEAERIRRMADLLGDTQDSLFNPRQMLPARGMIPLENIEGNTTSGPARVGFTGATAEQDFEFEYAPNRYYDKAGIEQIKKGQRILYLYLKFSKLTWDYKQPGNKLVLDSYTLSYSVDLGGDPYSISKQTMAQLAGSESNLEQMIDIAVATLIASAEQKNSSLGCNE